MSDVRETDAHTIVTYMLKYIELFLIQSLSNTKADLTKTDFGGEKAAMSICQVYCKRNIPKLLDQNAKARPRP